MFFERDRGEAGAYPEGCPRCPGTSLGQKMSGGEYRAKKLSARVKIFSAGEHPLSKFLGTPLRGGV